MSWTLQDDAALPYLRACLNASQSSDFFRQFKRDGAYRAVLEHVTLEDGKLYLDEIEIDYMDILDEIKENVSLGDPITCDYEKVGWISPTTVRYLKIRLTLLRSLEPLLILLWRLEEGMVDSVR